MILRDLDGVIWRSWDVTTVPANAGETVSATITGVGMPVRAVLWQCDLEVHAMLSGPPLSSGEVSTSWRGVGLYQDTGAVWRDDLNCSVRGQQNRPSVQVSAPASVSCVSQPAVGAVQAGVVLTWPHVGSAHTYSITARDKNSGNVLAQRSVTAVPAQVGQNVTAEIATAGLNLALRTSDAAVAEIRGVVDGVQSTGFLTQPIAVQTAAVACAAAPTARSATEESPSVTSPTSTPPSSTQSSGTSSPEATPSKSLPPESASPPAVGSSPAQSPRPDEPGPTGPAPASSVEPSSVEPSVDEPSVPGRDAPAPEASATPPEAGPTTTSTPENG